MAGLSVLGAAARAADAPPCPQTGAALQVTLVPAPGAGPSAVRIQGALDQASCTDRAGHLDGHYSRRLTCQPGMPETCRFAFTRLQPGSWTNRIIVTDGEANGQHQGRTQLLLDRRAGDQTLSWPLYRSVQTVASLDDNGDCDRCLRAALVDANAGRKPALVQFAPQLAGSIILSAPLPPLAAGDVTIDGFDADGIGATRTIDANGLDASALKLVSARNQVLGLRVANVGGDSDVLLIEGASANDNRLESLEVTGRTLQVCGADELGCLIDGVCYEPTPQHPQGVCGDDGIAVRTDAGTAGPNLIRSCLVTGARDKGIKISDGGVAIVEHSMVTGNADGGLQATLGGKLTARENVSADNHGTNSANGLAVNGAAVNSTDPGTLDTQGNLSLGNALRGISVRSLSIASLHDDFVCGNGIADRGNGFGVAVLDATGGSALATATGLAVVHNVDGGVLVSDTSRASFAPGDALGANAFAFNGPAKPASPMNFRNLTALPIDAAGNAWEHCGPYGPCDLTAIRSFDVFAASAQGTVMLTPALPTRSHSRAQITAIEPPFAAAGDLVRIYGSGFNAIDGAGESCDTVAAANTCQPLRGNCVVIDHSPAEVVAVTPTMLVVRAPFTCVEPVSLRVRTRWAHGSARADFCRLAPDASGTP